MSLGGQAEPPFHDLALLVLAAGRSTRMGSPKALVEFEGRPLLEHLLASAAYAPRAGSLRQEPQARSLHHSQAGNIGHSHAGSLHHSQAGSLRHPALSQFGDVVVVLGHHREALLPVVERAGYRHVTNPNPDRGRTGSVQVGLRALDASIKAVFLQPVDCPIILPETYAALATALGSSDVVIPCFRGPRGHPPLFSAKIIPRILAAGPDEPLRNLLQAPGVDCRFVEVDDPGVVVNIDRPEDLQALIALRAVYGQPQSPT